jgi:hypothetical protein
MRENPIGISNILVTQKENYPRYDKFGIDPTE